MDPKSLIAHREPFLFVDQITSIEPGVGAKGFWTLTGDEWFFKGHFPFRPTLPGVLMVESLAQLGACALLSDPRFEGKLPLFGGIEKARFRKQVLPGDTLELEVELKQLSSKGGKGMGRGFINGKLAVSAELFFVLVAS